MKKSTKIILSITIIMIICIISYFTYSYYQSKLTKNLKNSSWMSDNIAIVKDASLGPNIYKVYKNKNISIYNLNYQKTISQKIKELTTKMTNEYIVIYNPYGTNTLSLNIYFKDTSDFSSISYDITTDESNIPTYTNTLLSTKNTKAYQIIGLVADTNNKISLTISKNNNQSVHSSFNINMSDIELISQAQLTVTEGKSSKELAPGLYAMLGNDSDTKDYLALYDNNGIIRSEIPILSHRVQNILFKDKKMYFSISQTQIVAMNNLGEITAIYDTGKYELHNDYTFDDAGNLLVLASNTTKDTEEDCIIKINTQTKEVTEVIDFAKIFKDYVKTCQLDTESTRDEGTDGLDWLHLNSLDYVGDNLYLSSRETSSLLKIAHLSTEPQLEYIISNKNFWQDTAFASYVFEPIGDFKIHAGQHNVKYLPSSNPDEYYLHFFNNNYGVSKSQPAFNYQDISITNDNAFQGDNSYYYKYKVNEKNKTFELVDSFKVDYSGLGSSIQNLSNDNILVASGTPGLFAEYDEEHNLIKKFTAKLNKYSLYRVYKYDFTNFWFQKTT